MPAFFMGFLSTIRLIPAFAGGLWNVILVAFEIGKWIHQLYDREQRASVARALKEAVKESRTTLDNTKLMNIINPDAEPFPRKLGAPPV